MRTLFYPIQDATIYSEFPTINTGYDEILEVGKSENAGNNAVHSLLQFDLSSVGLVPSGAKFELNMFLAKAGNLKYKQVVNVRPIAESWTGGSGYLAQDVFQDTDGTTWTLRQSGSLWASGSAGNTSLPTSSSVSLSNPLTDLSIDVTAMVTAWLSGSTNNGFAVSFPSASEADVTNKGNLKFFSNETHTVYRPHIAMTWDDQQYVTGSLTQITGSLLVVPLIRPSYAVGEIARVDLAVREKAPTKTFGTVFTAYQGNHYLPATATYSIVDDLAGTTVIPFGSGSKISCDGTSSYFNLSVANMYPQRFYRVKIKVDHDGLSEIFDAGTIFKVR